MRTVLDVFPGATLWCHGQLLVGTLRPLRIDAAAIQSKWTHPETRRALEEIGLPDFATLTSWYTAGPRELKQFVGEGPVLTDDRPRLDYFRSLPRRDPLLDLSTLRGDVGPPIDR